jgi:hypothetical protein
MIVSGAAHERMIQNGLNLLRNNNRFRGPPTASRVFCVDISGCTF